MRGQSGYIHVPNANLPRTVNNELFNTTPKPSSEVDKSVSTKVESGQRTEVEITPLAEGC